MRLKAFFVGMAQEWQALFDERKGEKRELHYNGPVADPGDQLRFIALSGFDRKDRGLATAKEHLQRRLIRKVLSASRPKTMQFRTALVCA
jgi:hypothetical protein